MTDFTSGTPARQRALAFLREAIQTCRQQHALRLPTLKELARRAGVSQQTMWHTVSLLKSQGTLVASPRRGISLAKVTSTAVIGAPQSVPTVHTARDKAGPSTVAQPRALWVEQQIRQAALTGALATGTIHRPKEFCQRLGVCHRTLAPALASLVEARILTPQRRGYVVTPTMVSEGAHNTVVLYAVGNQHSTPELFTPRTADLLRLLEHECIRLRLNLRMVFYDFRQGVWPAQRQTRRMKAPLGSLLWTAGIPLEACREAITRLIPSDSPLCILSESEDVRSVSAPGRFVKRYSLAVSGTCAQHVGRYLLRLGHRRVAFVSPMHETDWSCQRAKGLQEVYRQAGLADAVVIVTAGGATKEVLDATLGRKVWSAAEGLTVDALWKGRPLRPYRNQVAEALSDACTIALVREAKCAATWSLLAQADPVGAGCTAIVGVNDIVALTTTDFLARRQVQVPGQVSVVGFDDELAAMTTRVTSYNFNCAALVGSMLDHIVKPTAQRPDNAHEVDGFVVERGTTASRKHSVALTSGRRT